jgi:SAM-dependent methyltransferase
VTASFKDHFSGHAQDYREYRPEYPLELFAFLATLAPRDAVVWDCGAGNGQASTSLAERFARVFATDASARQIQEATPHPRVEYAVAPAERCPLPDHTVELVTVAQALHWFNFDAFYREVNRVCRPGGCLAVWTYDLHSVNAAIDPVLQRFQDDYVGPYWPPERKLVEAGYQTIPFPFEPVPTPQLEMTADWDFPHFAGYMNTWSSTKAFVKAKGFNPVELLTPDFAAVWGEPSTIHRVRWQFYLRVGRVG